MIGSHVNLEIREHHYIDKWASTRENLSSKCPTMSYSNQPAQLQILAKLLIFCDLTTVFVSKGYPFKNIFDFTTVCDWDCVAAEERLLALHYSVDFIFLSVGIVGFIVEL